EGKPRPLAAREPADRLEDPIAAKRETAEEVPRGLLAERRIRGRHVLERRARRIERVDLLLREVADGEMRARLRVAFERLELAREQLDQRRFPGAVRAEETDPLARRYAELDAAENGRAAVAHGDRIETHERIGQAPRRAEREIEAGLRVHRRDLLHPLDHLQPRLRLPRLARLRAEPVDEALQMRDAPLLRLVSRGLARELGRTLRLEARVVAGVKPPLAVREMKRMRRRRVEEISIVRDHEQRAAIVGERALEPQHRI